VVALPPHDSDHYAGDSERLLRSFGQWQTEWDEPSQNNLDANFKEQVNFAIQRIINGIGPIRLRFALAEQFGERCQVKRVATAAYKAIQDASQLPADVQRAVIATQRQEAIQGAIQDRAWGAVGSMLARAGEVAGELREDAGLAPDDLRLVVEIEGEQMPLPAGETEPLSTETAETEMVETGETELA
jgi:hypothetical protein